MRLFVSIELPKEVRNSLRHAAEQLAGAVKAKWTAADQFHLTLKFLGEVPDPQIPKIIEHLRGVRFEESLSLQTSGLVCFPPHGPIRIIAAEMKDVDGRCSRLQAEIDSACHAAGFPPEARRWTPHVTVGRVKDRAGAAARTMVMAYKFPQLDLEIDEFSLMESRLDRIGPTYIRVATFLNAARRTAENRC
jgi:2'-5' RNA ligase